MKQNLFRKAVYISALSIILSVLWFGSARNEFAQDVVESDSGKINDYSFGSDNFIVSQKTLPYAQRVGEDIFNRYCMVCHGDTGEGNGFNAYTLAVKPRDFTGGEYLNALSDARLAEAIREGGRGVNKSVLMPIWGNRFSDLEISFIVQYIRLFAQSDAK